MFDDFTSIESLVNNDHLIKKIDIMFNLKPYTLYLFSVSSRQATYFYVRGKIMVSEIPLIEKKAHTHFRK